MVGPGHALLHQGAIAANKVDPGLPGCLVQSFGQRQRVPDGAADQGDGRYRDALVYDGYAEIPFDFLAYPHQVFRLGGDAAIDPAGQALFVIAHAPEQGDPHGDGAHVQPFLVDHVQGFEDFSRCDHDRHLPYM